MHDVKTYTTQEAKAEWERSSLGRRRMLLARVDQRDADMAKKNWDDLDAQERKLAHQALNEDFFAPTWYVNVKGVRINLFAEMQKAQEVLDWEEGQAHWDKLPTIHRYGALLANGIGNLDAEQGQFTPWEKLSPELRGKLLPFMTEMVAKREKSENAGKEVQTIANNQQMSLF